jgi:bacterioferritin-associated ferredoxin
MIVCVCRNVSESELANTIAQHGCECVDDVRDCLGACECCRMCEETIEDILEQKDK